MHLWIVFPISLSLVSFIGTWTIYGLALRYNHVCSLSDWEGNNFCRENITTNCCSAPTISTSGANAPENSLFTATINAGSFLFLLFCVFHHAHILEKNTNHSMLSKIAMVFGVVSAFGAFAAANFNPKYLTLMHHLGAAVSFLCICFYTPLLTWLTVKCALTGYEKFLFPFRVVSSGVQIIATICYTIAYTQKEYYYIHLSALFEWILSINLELFELSYVVEFSFFSSFMISNLLSKREEEKPLMLCMS